MKRIMIWSVMLGLGLALSARAAAPKAASHAAAKSWTGCLEKGDEANTYKLTHVTGGEDLELIGAPASLKMSEHVGHKVEVSGMAMSAAAAEKTEHMAEKKEKGHEGHEMKEEKGERHVKVTGLKHVAPTCP